MPPNLVYPPERRNQLHEDVGLAPPGGAYIGDQQQQNRAGVKGDLPDFQLFRCRQGKQLDHIWEDDQRNEDNRQNRHHGIGSEPVFPLDQEIDGPWRLGHLDAGYRRTALQAPDEGSFHEYALHHHEDGEGRRVDDRLSPALDHDDVDLPHQYVQRQEYGHDEYRGDDMEGGQAYQGPRAGEEIGDELSQRHQGEGIHHGGEAFQSFLIASHETPRKERHPGNRGDHRAAEPDEFPVPQEGTGGYRSGGMEDHQPDENFTGPVVKIAEKRQYGTGRHILDALVDPGRGRHVEKGDDDA